MFDPNKTRYHLSRTYGIKMHLDASLADTPSDRAQWGVGSAMVSTSVRCVLVGQYNDARMLLPKATSFLQAAVDQQNLRLGPLAGAVPTALYNLALCKWLCAGEHDLDSLRSVVAWRQLWFDWIRDSPKSDVQLVLPYYLDAEEHVALLELYERFGLKKPTKLRNIQGQGTMCYCIARQRLGLEYTADEIEDALRRFLARRVPKWLGGDGNYDGTAHWMKLAFWRPGDDPFATVLKCYEFLPGLEPPAYPSMAK